MVLREDIGERGSFGDTDDLSKSIFSGAVGTEVWLALIVLPGLIVKGSCLGGARVPCGL